MLTTTFKNHVQTRICRVQYIRKVLAKDVIVIY